jgi:hypothetical protein
MPAGTFASAADHAATQSGPRQFGETVAPWGCLNIRSFHFQGTSTAFPRSVAPGISCLRAPTRYMPLAAVQGAGLSQRVFSSERAHKRAPLFAML